MDKITLLYICGTYNIAFVIFHILFWKIFNWKDTLEKGAKSTKAVIQIINIQLIYLFAIMAYIYIFYTDLLMDTKIGKLILIAYAGFWILRFVQQFVFLKIKGKFVVILTLIFLFGAIIHLLPILL